MLRTLSLVGMAAQAEGRRLKAQASATANRVGLYAAAGLMGLAAFVMLHILAYNALHRSFGPITAAAVLMVVDLVVAGILVFLASRGGRPRDEIEARAVRNVALTGAAESAVSGFATKGAPLLALGGIVLAALWPKLRGARRR